MDADVYGQKSISGQQGWAISDGSLDTALSLEPVLQKPSPGSIAQPLSHSSITAADK